MDEWGAADNPRLKSTTVSAGEICYHADNDWLAGSVAAGPSR
jgi:hypothetical protein